MTSHDRQREKREQLARTRAMLDRLSAEREAAGTCRHCGGPVPCWSPLGDAAVGRRFTVEAT